MAISESKKKVSLKSPFSTGSDNTTIKRNSTSPSSSFRRRFFSSRPLSGVKRAGSPNDESVISASVRSDWKPPQDVTKYPRYEISVGTEGIGSRSKPRSAIKQRILVDLPNSTGTNHIQAKDSVDFTPLRPKRFTTPILAEGSDSKVEDASVDGDSDQNWESERDKSWRRQTRPYRMSSSQRKDKDTAIHNEPKSSMQVHDTTEKSESAEQYGVRKNRTKVEGEEQEIMLMHDGINPQKDLSTRNESTEAKPMTSAMSENDSRTTDQKLLSGQPKNQGSSAVDTAEDKAAALDAISALDFSKLSIEDRTPKASSYRESRVTRVTRAAQRKIELEKEKDLYRITPLSKEWDMKVRHAVRNGHDQLSATDFARVVPEYSAARNQDNWLNDEVINSYLTMIVQHGKKEDRKDQVASHHAFNSFLYKNLSEKGYQSVRRWANRAKIGGKSLLETEKVFIPINQGMHWTLAVVEAQKKTITVYNSMGTSRGLEVASRLLQYVKEEVGATFEESEWSLKPDGATPQQQNSDDCGVFTITNARQIMLGKTPMDSYKTGDIPIQRRRIVAELINGGLLKSDS